MGGGAHVEAIIADTLRYAGIRHEFQPIWDLHSAELFGFEALARFPDGTSPQVVWAAAHTTERWLDRWRDLDRLSVREALRQAQPLPGRIFVNVSARYLGLPPEQWDEVLAAIGRLRPQPGAVVLEVTEGHVEFTAQVPAGVARLQRNGALLALDDAGRGATTSARLNLLRPAVHYVKLDRSLIGAWLEHRDARLDRWVRMADAEGVAVVAEGVEDRRAAAALRRAGVRYVQGYAFGRPAPAASWTPAQLAAVRPALRATTRRPRLPGRARGRPAPPAPATAALGVAPIDPGELGRTLYEGSALPICILDQRDCVMGLNGRAEAFWGARAGELVGTAAAHVLGIDLLEDGQPVPGWEAAARQLAGGRRTVCRVAGRDGRLHVAALVSHRLHHHTGPLQSIYVLEDLTAEALAGSPAWLLVDPVTHLANRHAWARESERLAAQGGALAFIDVEGLQAVNNQYGHRAGDELLAVVGRALVDAVPPGWLAVRHGGDEFVLVAPGASAEEVEAVTRDVAGRTARHGTEAHLAGVPRLSFGVAAFAPGGLTEAVRTADDVLYRRRGLLLPAANGSRLVLTETGRRALLGPGVDPGGQPSPAAARRSNADGLQPFEARRLDEEARWFVELVAPAPGSAVVEVGAGSGRITFDGGLADRVGPTGQLLVTDPAEASVQAARLRAVEDGQAWLRFLCAPAEELPLASGCADLVAGAGFLHFTDIPVALREMARVARPGGRVAVLVWLEFDWPPVWVEILQPVVRELNARGQAFRHFMPSFASLAAASSGAGLEIERVVEGRSGRLEFASPELGRDFLRRGGVVGLLLRGVAHERLRRVEAAVERRLLRLLPGVPPEDRAVVVPAVAVLARRPAGPAAD